MLALYHAICSVNPRGRAVGSSGVDARACALFCPSMSLKSDWSPFHATSGGDGLSE